MTIQKTATATITKATIHILDLLVQFSFCGLLALSEDCLALGPELFLYLFT